MRRAWLWSLPLLLLLPAQALAQGRVCDLRSFRDFRAVADGQGGQITYIQGPLVFDCTGGVTLRADSAVNHERMGELRFVGNVEYLDSMQHLLSDVLHYLGRESRLVARGNVVYRDRPSGSVVRGSELVQQQATEARPRSEVRVYGRPNAVLHGRGGAAGSPGTAGNAAPIVIDSDSMLVVDQERFIAFGDVHFTRADLTGRGERLEYDEPRALLTIEQGARVVGDRFELAGERIEAAVEGEEIRTVLARGDASFVGEDLRVDAPEVHAFLTDGELERFVARGASSAPPRVREGAPRPDAAGAEDGLPAGPPPGRDRLREPGDLPAEATGEGVAEPMTGAEPGRGVARAPEGRVHAMARDLRVEADSLEVIAPGEALERITAVGRAFTTRLLADPDASLPELLANDWVDADTIVAWFAGAPLAAVDDVDGADVDDGAGDADTADTGDRANATDAAASVGERVMERLLAIAGDEPARALHRSQGAREAGGPAELNYLVARRIDMLIQDEEVVSVAAEGPVRGVYLTPRASPGNAEEDPDPVRPAPPERPDTRISAGPRRPR